VTFKIDADRKFSKEIMLSDDQSFVAVYRARSDDEIAEYDFTVLDEEKRFLRDTVIGVEDVEDADGGILTFSPELLDGLLGFADIRLGLLRGYRAAVAGARAGN